MAESQSDRLKRELRFLKESFEAGIISEEEFNKGKTRIENKLAEWGEGVVEEYKEEDQKKEENTEEKQEKLGEYEEKEKDVQEITEKKTKKTKTAKKEKEEIFKEDEFEDEEDKGVGIGKILIFALAIIAIIFLIKACAGAGSYKINTDLAILNDERCDSCDTRGAENVIEKLFPGLTKTYIDYNTKEGKAMYNDLGIQYLPAYIFKNSIENTETWKTNPNIKNSFEQKKEYWLLKPDQTNSEWKP